MVGESQSGLPPPQRDIGGWWVPVMGPDGTGAWSWLPDVPPDTPDPDQWTPMPASPKPPGATWEVAKGIATLIAIGYLAVAAFRAMADDGDPTNDGPEGHGRTAAEYTCQAEVTARLKAPGTADFGAIRAYGTRANGYTVNGTVDAQNSFGAKLRNDFTCDIDTDGRVTAVHGLQ